MSNLLGKFQTRDFTYWKGMTKNNHLSAIYRISPQKLANFMIQLRAYRRGPSIESLLSQFPTKEFENDEEYTWDVVGTAYRNIPLLEARDENGSPVTLESGMVGANTAPFYLVFAEDWFADGEYLEGNLEQYQYRILGEPRMEGSNAVYTVELAAGNTDGVPAERLLAGEKFSIIAAFVEKELSRKVGDVRFATPVSMRNEFSVVRIQHKVPGTSMLKKKLAVGLPIINPNTGKSDSTDIWMHNVDYAVETQFSDYKNNALAWGRSNRNSNGEYKNIGKSGGAIRTGDGLFAQALYGNVRYYNTFTLDLIEDALYSLSYNQADIKDRTYILRTGEKGAIQFHKAVKQEVSGWQEFTVNADALGMVQKTTSPMHSTSLSAGFQFTEFRAPNGVVVKIEIDKSYDDDVRNKLMHPNGGPVFSYRYDIWDMGSSDSPNIFKCAVKNKPEFRGYQWGPFANPFTDETNNNFASYDEDSAVIHKMATLGVAIMDPTRVFSLIPAVLQG